MKKIVYGGIIILTTLLVSFMVDSTLADNSIELKTGVLFRVYYNSKAEAPENTPQPITFNLSDYVIQLPSGLTKEELTFWLVDDSNLQNGSLSFVNNKGEVTFTPAGNFHEGTPFEFTYLAEGRASNGVLYNKVSVVKIVVLDFEIKPGTPGFFNNTGTRCFADMGEVDFIPRYKFISGAYNDLRVLRNFGVKVPNSGNTSLYVDGGRIYEFQHPLVGDLDGDGKPEIIALGTEEQSGLLPFNPYVQYMYIFDGQTGKVLCRYDFTSSCIWAIGAMGNHSSPGNMVLIDSDRDGSKEVVFSTGWGYSISSNLIKRLISLVITKNGRTWKIEKNPKWNSGNAVGTSSIRYDQYGSNRTYPDNKEFTKPVLQVVDLDGDGNPEIIAYNKIFNAIDGKLIITLEDLRDTGIEAGKAYVGRDRLAREKEMSSQPGDHQIGFSYIYDLDFDGKYEICAGGKVYYNISTRNKTYEILDASQYVGESIPDGHTAVADVDSDGKPEIIASYLTDRESNHRIMVWSPELSPSNKGATLIAKLDIPLKSGGNDEASGSHSYIYIADINGKEQYGKKFPEISILGPKYYSTSYSGGVITGYPVHPTVASEMQTTYIPSGSQGLIVSFTWDDTPNLSVNERLKVSFMMEHVDRSCNTGFTLFDFDNDGVNDICYRDNTSLRIIAASEPFVALNNSNPSVIRFKSYVNSGTGFEYPVITDLDNDFSADILVTGNDSASHITSGYLYAIEGANANLAPARVVWNQFMYSPFKIKDDLTTPLPGETDHPLSPKYAFFMKETDTSETYVFNNTLTQVPIFGVFEKKGRRYIKPVVRTADVVIDTAFINKNNAPLGSLDFVLRNTGDASVNENTPIKIYKNQVGSDKIYQTITVGQVLYPGDDPVTYQIPFKNSTDVAETYIVRVGDDSFTNGKGDVWRTDKSSYKDCYWPDNEMEVGIYVLKSDYYTVYVNEKTVFDILTNDIFEFYKENGYAIPNIDDFEFRYPEQGDYGKLTINNNENYIEYEAPAIGGLIHIYYLIDKHNIYKEGNIYIYVLEKCIADDPYLGDPYILCAKPIPQTVYFNWHDEQEKLLENEQKAFVVEKESPYIFYVQPIFNNMTEYSYLKDYLPKKRFEVSVSDRPQMMKWVGWSTSWEDILNWVIVKEDREVPAVSPPKATDHVLIPSGTLYYPILTGPAQCSGIDMRDRSMLAGIHHLTYDSVKVELNLASSERDRFIMWSAPLRSVYSGDYHFKNANNQPQWGDVYMNFFQSKNPDDPSSKAYKNMFTGTFGSPGKDLELGRSFNLKVIQTSSNYDKPFLFPQTATSYTYIRDGQQMTDQVRREKGNRLITDGYPVNANDKTINLPVEDEVGYKFMQVVNPYIAYLDVYKFLDANKRYIEPAYKIWNGRVNEDNITIYVGEPIAGQRFVITDGNLPVEYVNKEGVRYIPPLQSFFVMKKNENDDITALKVSPEWTTTINPGYQNPYIYARNNNYVSEPKLPVIAIEAVQADKISSTAIHYLRNSDGNDQSGAGNAQKLFYEQTPLSIYSLSAQQEPLAINRIAEKESEVKIGLRTNLTGQIVLEFSGMDSFEERIFLVDNLREGDDMIDIKKHPSYQFNIIKELLADEFIEINDRFSLLMMSPTDIKEDYDDKLNIFSSNGNIHINSYAGNMDKLQIYDSKGQLIYISKEVTDRYVVPVPAREMYIVRVNQGKEQRVSKILVK